jgi:2'-5' RNA ligase
MQKKKIFIEIAVPGQIQRKLLQKVEKWQNLPVKWMKENSIHLTVAFIGYVDESVVPEICANVSEAVSALESFDLEMDTIGLGPDPNDPKMTKMIWAVGKPSQQLKSLNEAVEKSLGMFIESHKHFSPHITLGRIRKLKWEALLEKPVISEAYKFFIPVDSVVVMESKGGGEEYVMLEECPLS